MEGGEGAGGLSLFTTGHFYLACRRCVLLPVVVLKQPTPVIKLILNKFTKKAF